MAISAYMVAKGFAKVEGYELFWAIESNGHGSILAHCVEVKRCNSTGFGNLAFTQSKEWPLADTK